MENKQTKQNPKYWRTHSVMTYSAQTNSGSADFPVCPTSMLNSFLRPCRSLSGSNPWSFTYLHELLIIPMQLKALGPWNALYSKVKAKPPLQWVLQYFLESRVKLSNSAKKYFILKKKRKKNQRHAFFIYIATDLPVHATGNLLCGILIYAHGASWKDWPEGSKTQYLQMW